MTCLRGGLAVSIVTAMLAGPALAQKGVPSSTVTVLGTAMASDHAIMDSLQAAPEFSIFVSLLRAAGLADSLQTQGPFTVFAPTNAAFAILPAEILERLRRPENKAALGALLATNIVSGNYSSARLHYLVRQAKGSAELDTINDGKLLVQLNGPQNLMVKDAKGNAADIVLYDIKQTNGVLLVTDRVMQPG